MKIGFLVSFRWHPLKGGGKIHIYQVIKRLTEMGHTFHSAFYYWPAPLVTVYRQRELFKFLSTIDVLYIRVDGKFAMEKFTLLKILKPGLKVVWEINSPVEEMLMRGKTQAQVNRWVKWRKFLSRFADAAICVSREMQDDAKNNLAIKDVHFVPNGSDPELFSPQKKDANVYKQLEGKFKLVWAGCAYYSWQGWDIVIEVAKKIQKADPSIQFILITQTEEIEDPGSLPENLLLIDQTDYLEMPKYLASADAGLCLYHLDHGKDKFYFSPLKLYDYMSSGIPVIATNVGQIGEVIEHKQNGMLVENEIDEIIESIKYLKDNPRAHQDIAVKARDKVVEYYNWDRVARITDEYLKGLVAQN